MRSVLRSTKNWAKGYGEAETLVRECTCNEEGPPDPRQLRQLANLTLQDLQTYKQVWTLLWNRTKHFQYIRHVQRGMQTMEYLLIHGNERVVQDVSDQLLTIKRLTTYKYYKDGSREVAGEVREQAKKLLALMEDMDALKKKREDAFKNRPKMGAITGFGSDQVKTKGSEPQVKGDIQTVHKWQDSPATPPAASSNEPGALSGDEDSTSGPAKKKKKKKKKKKNKEVEGEEEEVQANNEFGEFDAFPDIAAFPEAAAEPVVVEALDGPAKMGKVKRKAAVAAPVTTDVLGFGLEPGAPAVQEVAPPSGNFSFGEGDDWVSNLTQANQQQQQNNLFDDMFSAPAAKPEKTADDIFGIAATQPVQPAATAAAPEEKTDPLYQGFVNTDDIFGSIPKKRQPKAAPGKKTMAQLQAEKQLNSSFAPQSTPATQQNNIFTQMTQPDPFAPAPVQQQNPFGFAAPQPNPFGANQPNPFGANQPNPFAAQPPQQNNPFGFQQPVQQPVQPQWGFQQQPNLYQAPQQQQQQQANPFDKIGGYLLE